MDTPFGIAAYRSRQQVIKTASELKKSGIEAKIVSTPREISAGCGLSVRFDLKDANGVKKVVSKFPSSNLIGLYRVDPGAMRSRLSVLSI